MTFSQLDFWFSVSLNFQRSLFGLNHWKFVLRLDWGYFILLWSISSSLWGLSLSPWSFLSGLLSSGWLFRNYLNGLCVFNLNLLSNLFSSDVFLLGSLSRCWIGPLDLTIFSWSVTLNNLAFCFFDVTIELSFGCLWLIS